MAQVKLDISEYEEMKKNARLLEEALEKQQEQSEKIEKLKQEKIDALENNEKKVTIVTESRHEEIVYGIESFFSIRERLRRLVSMMNDKNYSLSSTDYQHHIYEEIMNTCFKKSTSMSEPNKTVITKGLDEIREDLKKDIREDYERQLKDSEEQIKELKKLNNTLKEKSDKLSFDKGTLLHENNKYEEDLELLTKENLELENFLEIYDENPLFKNMEKINNILSDFNFFTAYPKLGAIKQLQNENK